jgi:hypothetical protein
MLVQQHFLPQQLKVLEAPFAWQRSSMVRQQPPLMVQVVL